MQINYITTAPMFKNYFAPDPPQLNVEGAMARHQRVREVENALLSHLMSGFTPTSETLTSLQSYINGENTREEAFGILYEAH